MLFGEKTWPSSPYYSKGMFAIFFPHDLHMPNIMIDKAAYVKKVVITGGSKVISRGKASKKASGYRLQD